jgi:predicted nucleic acid-binding protein
MTPNQLYGLHMPENILVDLNVILDVLLERRGFEASRDVIQLAEKDRLQICISAHMVTTFAYLLEEAKVPKQEILHYIDWLLRTFRVVSTDEDLLRTALKSSIRDYEDAVVERAAVVCQASVIVTRNVRDFKASVVPALLPESYLEKFSSNA